MTSDDETATAVHDSGNLPAIRDGNTGELAAIPPEADEQWIAAIASDHDDGHPAITLPPITLPPEPVLTPEEAAQEHLIGLWRTTYLGAHHVHGEWDPFWSHRAGQFLHAWRQFRALTEAGATPGCPSDTAAVATILVAQPGAPETEQEIGVRLASGRLLGHKVRCGGCRRAYTYTAEEPYYGSYRRTGGRCHACVLGPGAAKAGDGRPVMTLYDQLAAERWHDHPGSATAIEAVVEEPKRHRRRGPGGRFISHKTATGGAM